jgi:hypothetical protein
MPAQIVRYGPTRRVDSRNCASVRPRRLSSRAALVFTARAGNRQVEGVDIVRGAEDGSIAALTVVVRPMSGLQALARAVAQGLSLRPTGSPA